MTMVVLHAGGEDTLVEEAEGTALSLEFEEDYDQDPDDADPFAIAQWCNGAGISVAEDGLSIDVWISTGDPRGGFVMRVECMNIDGKREMRLSVPHPEGGFQHRPLTPLASVGYYRIG